MALLYFTAGLLQSLNQRGKRWYLEVKILLFFWILDFKTIEWFGPQKIGKFIN